MKFNFFRFAKEFGFGFATKYAFDMGLYVITKKQKFKDKRFALVDKWLYKKYGEFLAKKQPEEVISRDSKVWIFWAQGLESAPEIVKKCVESIKHNFKDNEVVVLTNDNFSEYVKIPDYILEKLEKKVFSLTHFSDILRAALLEKYGGIWLDATCFLAGSIFEDMVGKEFYSGKLAAENQIAAFASGSMWSAYFLASGKGNVIVSSLKNILFEYWKNHNTLMEYYLIDYIIKLAYNHTQKAKEMIDFVPENNQEIYKLADLLFEPFDEKVYKETTKNTKLFKLMYKYDLANAEKEGTFYKHIVETKEKI